MLPILTPFRRKTKKRWLTLFNGSRYFKLIQFGLQQAHHCCWGVIEIPKLIAATDHQRLLLKPLSKFIEKYNTLEIIFKLVISKTSATILLPVNLVKKTVMTRLMNLSCNIYLVIFVVIVGIITDVVICDFIDDLHLSSVRVRRGPPDCSRCRTELCRMYCGTPGGRKRSISDSQVIRKKFPIRRRISLLDSRLDRLSAERKQSIVKALVAKLHRHETTEKDHQLSENRYFSKKS